MVHLGAEALLAGEKEGYLAISNRANFSAFSLDLHIDKLYTRKEQRKLVVDEHALSQDDFIDLMLEEVAFDEPKVITHYDFYLWQPREEIYLAEGLGGEITSRSSWARLASRVQSVDEHLRSYHQEVWTKPLCSLNMAGTSVLVKPGDGIGQLFVDNGTPHVANSLVSHLLDTGEFVMTRDEKKLRSVDVTYEGGLVLTMGADIFIYQGGVLEPGNLKDEDFKKVTLNRFKDYYLPRGTFFISASAEHVQIPDAYLGHVSERDSTMSLSLGLNKELQQFTTHANAPYVGPKSVFQGNITFENTMKTDGYIRRGMKQSELYLLPVTGLSKVKKPSRYNNQQGATKSKL
jgi:deoxycytidine triphosphate deaminase